MTLAMNFIIHGEAVRFNRGKGSNDAFDFKHMKGKHEDIIPYVSSQCFKRHWREALECTKSPVSRKKNQAWTAGNPIEFIDDDLFGYMIAGAVDEEDSSSQEKILGPAEILSTKCEILEFAIPEQDYQKFLNELAKIDWLNRLVQQKLELAEFRKPDNWSSEKAQELIETFVKIIDDDSFVKQAFSEINGTDSIRKKYDKETDPLAKFKHILDALKKIKIVNPSSGIRETTRRTAPVRMHALVAFGKILTAKDFQTFSRDVPYTGLDSVLNPNAVGIYSCWMKSRIIVETHRIGKFYIGKNMDILESQVKGIGITEEENPYSRKVEKRKLVSIEEQERLSRYKLLLTALANIGNKQGPASGALHDGTLRPQGFIAANMKCCDSPFDYVWRESSGQYPIIDTSVLKDCLRDAADLFVGKDDKGNNISMEHKPRIYVGLPIGYAKDELEIVSQVIINAGFEPIIDTPRKALQRLAEDSAL